MLFYDCHRSVPAPFLTKTYHLVNDPSTDEIVSWGEDHTTFVVWRPPEFARDLLPNYFKHNNFSSFVRQLNTYGFRKVVPDRWEFANDFFRRGERHLLCEIHRRKALQAPTSGNSNQQSRSLSPSTSIEDQPPWGSPISSPLPSPIPPIHIVNVPPPVLPQLPPPQPPLSISDENERLRKDNNLLLSEVSRLRRLYEDTINMIQHQFKGASPEHFSSIVSSARIGQSSDCRALQQQLLLMDRPVGRRELENYGELSVHVRHQQQQSVNQEVFFCKNPVAVSFPSFQESMQQQQQQNGVVDLKQVCETSTTEVKQLPVKLFGVPLQHSKPMEQATITSTPTTSSVRHGLHASSEVVQLAGSKRRQPEPWDAVSEPVFLRPPPRKCLQGTSELGSETVSAVQAPWLQICATRDEGVYI